MNPMYNSFPSLVCMRLTFVMLLLFSWETIRVRAEQYQIEGEIAYYSGNDHVHVFTRSFQLTVSNCAWSIRVYVTQETDPTPAKRFEVVYDGQSMYYYTYLGIPNGSPVANKGVGEIDRGHIPFENASFANYIWLGLASACVFNQTGQYEMQAPWLLRDAKPKTYRTEVLLAGAPPHLPERITYNERSGIKPRPFENGWKVGEIRVHSRTNAGTLTIPNLFTFEQFKPKQNASTSDDVKSQYQVKVSVSSIILPNVTKIVPPQNDGVTLVHDRRLAITGGVSGITYTATNGNMPRSPDPIALKEFNKLSQIHRPSDSHLNSSILARRSIVLLFTISASIVVLIVVKKINQKN